MKTIMVAHRGAQKIAPENTLSAFRLAIKQGFRALECDVQLTSDGQLVVVHDQTVDRTTNGTGKINQLSHADIKKLQIGKTEHVPSLKETVHEVVVTYRCKLIIEIKGETGLAVRKVAVALADFIAALPVRYRRDIEVHSVWYEALRLFKNLCPDTTTAVIITLQSTAKQIIATAKNSKADGVSLGYEFVSPQILKICHNAGLFVDTWAVSDGVVSKRLKPFGLHALFENLTSIIIKT